MKLVRKPSARAAVAVVMAVADTAVAAEEEAAATATKLALLMQPTNRAPKPVDSGKEEGIEVIGKVVEKFRAGMFSIELDGGQIVLGTMAGRLRRNRIKVMNGDRVSVELSPYDLTKGRITYRHK